MSHVYQNFLTQPSRQFQDWHTGLADTRRFFVYDLDDQLPDEPGIYIFARRAGLLGIGWSPIYIGISNDVERRHIDHEKKRSAIRLGATHVHVHGCRNALARHQLEAAMIEFHHPPLNRQHK